MPLKYIAGKMMVVRALTGDLALVYSAPSSHPLAHIAIPLSFAAMTPMQVSCSMENPTECERLRNIKKLIIGGGAISKELEEKLRSFPNKIWSTYGMTETLSHIAMRPVSKSAKGRNDAYMPFDGVDVSLDKANGCLEVNVPGITDGKLQTNDIAEIFPDGTFKIIGRKDNVVSSGGIKMHIEDIEKRLSSLRLGFVITSVPDPVLSEALTLVYEGTMDKNDIKEFCSEKLGKYEVPKHFYNVPNIPLTETGKPARAKIKELALAFYREECASNQKA